MSSSVRHLSYLLRLWLEDESVEGEWRASLRDVHNGEQTGFRSMDDLCTYLRSRTADSKRDTRETGSKLRRSA